MQLKQLEVERKKIDKIDKRMLELTLKRRQAAERIAEIKNKNKLPVKDVVREKLIKKKWKKNAKLLGLSKKTALDLLCKLLNESREIQTAKPNTNIAFQGKTGSFSEIIAGKMFNKPNLLSCRSFRKVFEKIKCKKAVIGIIPVENTITGRIRETTDLIVSLKTNICGEAIIRVSHTLIGKKGQKINEIKQVFAHPETLRQCQNFLENLKKAELIAWFDGAGAVKKIKQKKNAVLIASKKVAKIHNLKILKKNIQDIKTNKTRFVVIGNKKCSKTGNDKTTVFFRVKHKPTALFNALKPLAKAKINITKIELIPDKNNIGEYLFWTDFEGHKDETKVAKALQEMKKQCISINVLGSYPKGMEFKV